MSNSKIKPEADELHFRLAVNLHYGAINLLNQSFDLLSRLGIVSKSEIERFHKFVQFYQHLLFRGSKIVYPEVKDEHSES